MASLHLILVLEATSARSKENTDNERGEAHVRRHGENQKEAHFRPEGYQGQIQEAKCRSIRWLCTCMAYGEPLYNRKRLSRLRNARRVESRRPLNGVRDQKVPEAFAMLVDCVSNMARARVRTLNQR
jgi:hypothetical protein